MIVIPSIHRHLNRLTRSGAFSGIVQIHQGDTVLHNGSYGYANRTWKIKNSPTTRYRLASVGKMFTAVAVLQLIEQGKLSMDTAIVPLLNLNDSQIPAEVTIRHLLTMTSGIADWYDESRDDDVVWRELAENHPITYLRTNRDYLPIFLPLAPYFPLGERYEYSNSSYILLALAIEQASRQPFPDYLRDHIFSPAGMLRTGFDALDDVVEETASGYEAIRDENDKLSGWQTNVYLTTPGCAGDGGECSSAADMLAFMRALRGGKLLSAAMTEEILTPQVEENFDGPNESRWWYSYGMEFLRLSNGRILRYGRPGEEGGVSCRVLYYPGADLDIIILCNQGSCASQALKYIHPWIMTTF